LDIFGKSIPLLVSTIYSDVKWTKEKFVEEQEMSSYQQHTTQRQTLRFLKSSLGSINSMKRFAFKNICADYIILLCR